ncbi:hypothetical protein MNBD_NITROSPIRAE03-423 [hydrothermal vent metagenome]|uniref:Glycosyltransferase 2-like domain-containing protein n=1 Tax=hydrothermal vent metagenome TaxID=652676 RepID=A0A3B1D951_9ZZZZ
MNSNTGIPNVAILIVNWNKKKELLNLLSSLLRFDYDQCKILLVDNASADGSVEAVREGYPEIRILQNKENLGATGGFNTGLRYILQGAMGEFDYIWLLDNDTRVESSTLRELLNVAESDSRVGLVGSKIMNSERPDFIVELGGYLDWRQGFHRPFLKNTRNRKELKDYYYVDYVATCSAMARVEALKNVGLMDERYFISWDDIDWGITFKRHGYQVVAVNQSITFHPAYSEKNWSAVSTYSKFRNLLLIFSKHTKKSNRILSLFRSMRRAIKKACFFWITGRPEVAKVYMLAIIDFLRNKWGRYDYQIDFPPSVRLYIQEISNYKRFLIIPPGNRALTEKIIQKIRHEVENPYICLLIAKERMSLFSDVDVEEIKALDSNKKFEYLRTLITLMREKFDFAVTSPGGGAGTFGNVNYAVKNVYGFDEDKKLFFESRTQPLKLFLLTILGDMTSLIVFPFVLIVSYRYRVKIVKKI